MGRKAPKARNVKVSDLKVSEEFAPKPDPVFNHLIVEAAIRTNGAGMWKSTVTERSGLNFSKCEGSSLHPGAISIADHVAPGCKG